MKDDRQTGFPSQIRAIIDKLRSTIELNSNFRSAKESIIELARGLDEDRMCEKDKICRQIKDILKDKISEGKITGKWVEECLPEEYKRDYSKCEQNSLSKVGKKSQEMVIDNNEKVCEETSNDLATAEQAESKTRITVYKDRYPEIKFAMRNSFDCFYIELDSESRTFVSAESDTTELIIAKGE